MKDWQLMLTLWCYPDNVSEGNNIEMQNSLW